MAAIINTVYPSYTNPSNYTGVNSAIRSAGIVRNPDHQQAILGLEREGKLGLTQFGLVKLPRDVLILQDEREAKVRTTRQGDQVTSSSKSDLDEERDLNKVDDRGDSAFRVDAVKARKPKTPGETQDEAVTSSTPDADTARTKSKEAASATTRDETRKGDARTDQEFASLVAQNSGDTKSEAAPPTRKKDEARKDRPSVIGSPSNTYATIQATTAAFASAHGENDARQSLNVLA